MWRVRVGVLAVVAALATSAWAGHKPDWTPGTIVAMKSSECGAHVSAGNSVLGSVLGTDGESAKRQIVLCKDYTLRTDSTIYTIRPKKQDAELLPVNAAVEFYIDKDKMKLRRAENKKQTEFIVLAEVAANPPKNAN
ncbi:MAG: hypothetical protein ACRD2H_08025 [Terriglobales bacterium]